MLGYYNEKDKVAGRLSSNSAARRLFVYTKNSNMQEMLCNLPGVGAKLGRAFNCTWSMIYAEVTKTLCSFGSLVLRVSLRLPSDLLYRLNCHVDKQLAVRDLFFAGLWIAGNSRRGEQIMP